MVYMYKWLRLAVTIRSPITEHLYPKAPEVLSGFSSISFCTHALFTSFHITIAPMESFTSLEESCPITPVAK